MDGVIQLPVMLPTGGRKVKVPINKKKRHAEDQPETDTENTYRRVGGDQVIESPVRQNEAEADSGEQEVQDQLDRLVDKISLLHWRILPCRYFQGQYITKMSDVNIKVCWQSENVVLEWGEMEAGDMKKKLHGRYDGMKYGWLKDTKKFILLLVAVYLALRLVVGFSFVKGDSMEPTLHSGELVMYLRLDRDYQKGDVVSVRIPSGEYYVKRIIALEGDTIDLRDGRVYLNEEPLEEPYIMGETEEQAGAVRYPFRLQKGQIFVMGDNREVSMDSRSFGVVGRGQIKGKLWFRAGWLYADGI